jgi:hypothetical protein
LTVADKDCAEGYLKALKNPLNDGMNLATSNWGSPNINMEWLDGETGCQGNCGGFPGAYTVSNL